MESICFFNTAIAWGGGEKWHFEVSSYLHSKGHPVVVIAHKKSVLLQRLLKAKIPAEAIELSNLSFINPLRYSKLKQLLHRYAIRTIVMNLSRDLKIAGPCAKALGIPNIIYRRGSAIPIKNSLLNRYYFGKVVTAVLANSEATKRTVLEKNPNLFPQEKIQVIYNGINIPEKLENGVPEHDKEGAPFIVMNLGRLEEQKNQQFLVALGVELKKRDMPFEIRIGGEGRLRPQLEQAIEEAQLTKEITLSGFIEDVYGFIQQADVFVLPSLWEGFGYVLAEAAICKKPIVAFQLSSNPELVLHGATGYLVPPNDVTEFANAVEQLYRNQETAKHMGEAGQKHAMAHFDKEKQLLKIEAYLLDG